MNTGNQTATALSVEDVPSLSNLEQVVSDGARSRRIWAIRIASIVVFLALWQFFGAQANPLMMSYPSAILSAAAKLAASGELLAALLSSLYTLMLGLIVSSVVGLGLGLLIGRYRAVEAATDWLVTALYALPRVAIVPLVIVWFGLGLGAKVFLVATVAVFPIIINTTAGVRNIAPYLLDVGAAFVASERQVFTKIILPSALPYMMTGLRLGVGRGIIGLVVAEFFTAVSGLGSLIVKYGNKYDTATMFVPILILMIFGVVLSATLSQLEKKLAPWRHTEG